MVTIPILASVLRTPTFQLLSPELKQEFFSAFCAQMVSFCLNNTQEAYCVTLLAQDDILTNYLCQIYIHVHTLLCFLEITYTCIKRNGLNYWKWFKQARHVMIWVDPWLVICFKVRLVATVSKTSFIGRNLSLINKAEQNNA